MTYKKLNALFLIFLCLVFISAFIGIDDKLSSFVKLYFTIIFVIFLISFSYLLFDLIMRLKQKLGKKLNTVLDEKEFINTIKSLSDEEKNVLSLFIDGKTQEKALISNDPAVAWLESLKLIIQTGQVDGNKKIFRIHPTTFKYLIKNPNSLY